MTYRDVHHGAGWEGGCIECKTTEPPLVFMAGRFQARLCPKCLRDLMDQLEAELKFLEMPA